MRKPADVRKELIESGNRREGPILRFQEGPFWAQRAAAREIEMLGPGTARVRISVVEMSAMLSCSMVQVGAFSDPANAASVASSFRDRGLLVVQQPGADGLTRVFLGPYDDLEQAERARDRYDGMVRPCN